MNVKISVFVICVEAIVYLLLHYLHDYKKMNLFLELSFYSKISFTLDASLHSGK